MAELTIYRYIRGLGYVGQYEVRNVLVVQR